MAIPNIESIIRAHSDFSMDDPAEQYVEATKMHRLTFGIDMPDIQALYSKPELIKATWCATKQTGGRVIELDDPDVGDELSQALKGRRTVRCFPTFTALSDADVSQLCWSADGVSGGLAEKGHWGRTAPSGGALYPRDMYLIFPKADSAHAGSWHYNPYEHRLEQVDDATIDDVFNDSWQQGVVANASACFVIAGVFWRNRFKYNLRGTRFTLIESGMVTQNLLLAAQRQHWASMPFGGYYDDELCQALHLDGLNESPLSVVFIGARGQQTS
jgi:SagB-type dehydrogenase family enzyme